MGKHWPLFMLLVTLRFSLHVYLFVIDFVIFVVTLYS